MLSLAKIDDRQRSLCAGLALTACLRAVGLPADAEIVRDEHGKPRLRAYPEWQFSLSHSGDYAVCALTDTPVGVDVEQRRSIEVTRLADRFFTAQEAALLASLPKAEQETAFLRLWTAKESVLKAQGSGLSGGLSSVPIAYGDMLRAPEPWLLKEYALPGYVLTVCGTGAFPDTLTVISSYDSVPLR